MAPVMIDIAYLRRSDVDAVDDNAQVGQSVDGDIWYLFQSKYGSAFQGRETILTEGQKVITTLTGGNNRLSEAARQLLGRLDTFRQQAWRSDYLGVCYRARCRSLTGSIG